MNTTTPNASSNGKRTNPGNRTKRTKSTLQAARDIAFQALIAQGISGSKAGKLLGLHPVTGSKLKKKLEQEQEGIKPFLCVERDEKLGRLVDHFMDKGLKIRKVKGSEAIAAGKIYADRRYPSKSESDAPSYTFIQTNLAMFAPDPDGAQGPVDITPGGAGTTTSCVAEGGNRGELRALEQFQQVAREPIVR